MECHTEKTNPLFELYKAARNKAYDYWNVANITRPLNCLENANTWFPSKNEYCIFQEGDTQKKEKLYAYYPSSLREHSDLVLSELSILLPDEKEVTALLPMLMMGFMQNRINSKLKDETARTTLFVEKVMDMHNKSHTKCKLTKRDIGRNKKIFRPKHFLITHNHLHANDFSVDKPTRILSLLADDILFLHLLIKTADICNVTLSFSIYAFLSGRIFYLNPKFHECFFSIFEDDFSRIKSLSWDDDPWKESLLETTHFVLNQFKQTTEASPLDMPIVSSYDMAYRTYIYNLKYQLPQNSSKVLKKFDDDLSLPFYFFEEIVPISSLWDYINLMQNKEAILHAQLNARSYTPAGKKYRKKVSINALPQTPPDPPASHATASQSETPLTLQN